MARTPLFVGLRRAGFDSAARLDLKKAWAAAYKSVHGPVKGAAQALAAGNWTEAARGMLQFIASPGPKGVAGPERPRRTAPQEE